MTYGPPVRGTIPAEPDAWQACYLRDALTRLGLSVADQVVVTDHHYHATVNGRAHWCRR